MDSNSQLKFALAVTLLRSKLLSKPSAPSSSTPSESNAQRWKRKAKERKQEILRLKQELKDLQDGEPHDLFPQSANCKCYFFDSCGQLSLSRNRFGDDSDRRINEVLHRRFLRQVRLKERKRRRDGSERRAHALDLNVDYELEQLTDSADFLVELCKTSNPAENDTSFTNLSHQAVDFILASLNSITNERKGEFVEGVITSLITRLVGRMCIPSQENVSSYPDSCAQFYVQHLLRKLGMHPYIGQRTMLAVSQRVSVLAETLLFMDPFDDAFPSAHSCMFILIQFMEFLISDYTKSWTSYEGFEFALFEEWLKSVLQARKALALLEKRNGLYMLYMDRVSGELAKQLGHASCLKKLNPDILDNLFR